MAAFDTLAAEPTPAKAAEKPTLLIVDDEPGPARIVADCFQRPLSMHHRHLRS